ncbi:L-tyrosine/L-tryptophan isonitrile synthase family protein [Mycetocola saprophilus]|uniref:L-tyrosine/L-tryptophan isonitrile synthase family protein n=1 Tax=Mycetocola saprophilus TaxID=76636 RepID=UPI003BF08F64
MTREQQLPYFAHVSFTDPGWKANPQKLLDAARRWRAPDSVTIERFNIEQFQKLHGVQGIPTSTSGKAMRDKIISVLTTSEFLTGPKAHSLDPKYGLLTRVTDAIGEARPIEIVIPSFAGRPHNPAAHRRVAPDLGELYALQLLKNISDTVAKIYAPGAIFTLLLDGRAYRGFYGYSDQEGMPYVRNLRNQIDQLGARGQIDVVEMYDLISARSKELSEIDSRVRNELKARWSDSLFPQRSNLIRALRQGTETTAISSAFIEIYKAGQYSPTELQGFFRQAEIIVYERAEETAFEYAVLMTKLKELDIIGRAFPRAIRGTVHPKPGQYAPRMKNPKTRISPWHGVAILTKSGEIITEYETLVYQDFECYRAVFIRGDEAPFYYEEIVPDMTAT